jgi:hypothetical protein
MYARVDAASRAAVFVEPVSAPATPANDHAHAHVAVSTASPTDTPNLISIVPPLERRIRLRPRGSDAPGER